MTNYYLFSLDLFCFFFMFGMFLYQYLQIIVLLVNDFYRVLVVMYINNE